MINKRAGGRRQLRGKKGEVDERRGKEKNKWWGFKNLFCREGGGLQVDRGYPKRFTAE